MDLHIQADDAQISTTRGSGQVTCYLAGVNEGYLLSTENFQSIPIMKWVGEWGVENVLDTIKENYPELFNN